jgi:hypothetical protein
MNNSGFIHTLPSGRLIRVAFTRTAALPDALASPRASFRLPGSPSPPSHFHDLLVQLGPAVARCCARVSASRSLALLLRMYAAACADVVFQPGRGQR